MQKLVGKLACLGKGTLDFQANVSPVHVFGLFLEKQQAAA
jgi:hypothetical protein